MHYKFIILYNLLFFAVLSSCNTENKNNKTNNSTNTEADAEIKEEIDTFSNKTEITSIADYVSGILPNDSSEDFKKLTQKKHWIEYASKMNKRYNSLDSSRLSIIRKWSTNELKDFSSSATNVFYPFSGPDFLNAFTFFPNQEKIIMMALESPGKLPDTKQLLNDSSYKYFLSIEKSLWSVLNFSFFRTNSMKVDLNAEDLNGAIHLITFFIHRTGNKVINIEEINLKQDSANTASCEAKAIKISYWNKNTSKNSEIVYISADISNPAISGNKCVLKYIESLNKGFTTYIKSASYLLHSANFSKVRDFILNGSNVILQDDSGIPLKYIDDKWNKKFYGTYDKPIPLFKNKFQSDLKDIYQSSSNVKSLPFGIGYDYKLNESNLMLFVKNK